jgi:hypothetical protein
MGGSGHSLCMRMNRGYFMMVLFAGLILFAGSAGASNLTLSKTVDGGSSYQSGENITWRITVVNHNDTEEQVQVTEQIPADCVVEEYLSDQGTIDDNVWSVDLAPDASEELVFNMSCTPICGSRTIQNIANITSPAPGLDDNPDDNNASASVTVEATDCVSNLTLKKSVLGAGTYTQGENITWLLELTNNNASESLPVVVIEQVPEGCALGEFEESAGIFDGKDWSLTLGAGSTQTLQINVSCARVCGAQSINNVASITSPGPENDVDPADNQASSVVTVEGPACANITVRPVTLNLKSNGVLTVFFTIEGELTAVEEDGEEEEESTAGLHIDKKNSSLSCNGANASKILFSMKDGGTIMGKFRRQSLALEGTDGSAQLDCEGTIDLSDGRTITIQGSQIIRVIHPEATGKQSLIQRILAFFGFVGDSGGDELTSPVDTAALDTEGMNLGQLKKMLKNDQTMDEPEETQTATVTTPPSKKGKPEDTGNGKGKKETNPGSDRGKGKGNS